MALEAKGLTVSMLANESFATAQYKFAKGANASGVCKAAIGTDGVQSIGVIQDNPAIGVVSEIMVTGVTKVYYGNDVTAGDAVQVDSTGRAITLASGKLAGIALVTGTTGDLGTILLK